MNYFLIKSSLRLDGEQARKLAWPLIEAIRRLSSSTCRDFLTESWMQFVHFQVRRSFAKCSRSLQFATCESQALQTLALL